MRVPHQFTRSVAFVGVARRDNGRVDPIGTVFFVGRTDPEDPRRCSRVFVITALHVIDLLRERTDKNCYLMFNYKNGEHRASHYEFPLDEWFCHPDENIDVAVVEYGIPAEIDHLVLPIEALLTKDDVLNDDIQLGEEIFIVGLFNRHFGERQFTPIVRIGNLSAFADEPIKGRLSAPTPAHLIEVLSLGGLSGSPAFLNLGFNRIVHGRIQSTPSGDPKVKLLGLVQSHFEQKFYDSPDEDSPIYVERMNIGIALVVPSEAILDTIEKFENVRPYVKGKFIGKSME